ncbi:hypothetical protein ASPWEDRAFT_46923 [Aspergillus wentii DTO 134E9]|uniref:Uncharacterized protein n=1 Tax=Aspergillus wentii DTO 134E9 TaxID=1073089 RepID=A0A1L9R3S7_ASPWE|nr:uncharacterized protein ASPWEDRAFT_46923 [Aspergillus wentii DTO 134E9]KAI9923414.1 hypothetical protein MW887_009344 [Aspergillus wentii]OJJ29564.1 hypothetical protein ASPWEDRAFT_46923 [Aspergillus wentii DTO 134E9]
MGDGQKAEIMIFANAERSPDDLVVTYFDNGYQNRLNWNEYKSIGPIATAAVVRAGWNCAKLEQIAQSVRDRRFCEDELDRLREQARAERRRISTRGLSEPVSVFD